MRHKKTSVKKQVMILTVSLPSLHGRKRAEMLFVKLNEKSELTTERNE